MKQNPSISKRQPILRVFKDSEYKELVEYLGERVKIVPGSELNIKITRKEDLVLGESLLSRIR